MSRLNKPWHSLLCQHHQSSVISLQITLCSLTVPNGPSRGVWNIRNVRLRANARPWWRTDVPTVSAATSIIWLRPLGILTPTLPMSMLRTLVWPHSTADSRLQQKIEMMNKFQFQSYIAYSDIFKEQELEPIHQIPSGSSFWNIMTLF